MKCPIAASGVPQDASAATESNPCEVTQWAQWALQFTPHVTLVLAPDAQRCDVLLSVAASLRLWGGLEALMHNLRAQSNDIGIASLAAGPTGLVALARLYAHDEQVRELSNFQQKPDLYPLSWLAASIPHLTTLHQLGCTTWGALRALPRGGITRRFGKQLLEALDKAYGLQPEVYDWLLPSEYFAVTHELLADVENAPALVFTASRQLKLMQAWLRSRHQGVLACRFTWHLDRRRGVAFSEDLLLETAEPTQDIRHLEKLLVEHLARCTLPAPAHSVSLCSVRCEPIQERVISLLPEEQKRGDALHQFIERVASKLGDQAIRRPVLIPDHRPDAAVQWQSATAQKKSALGSNSDKTKHLFHRPLRPCWLLPEPIALLVHHQQPHYHGPLRLLQEAERIEVSDLATGTPSSSVVRDYFIAWSPYAKLLWIFRERARQDSPRWYLHGMFE